MSCLLCLELTGTKYPATYNGHELVPLSGRSFAPYSVASDWEIAPLRCSGSIKATARYGPRTGSWYKTGIIPGICTTCRPIAAKPGMLLRHGQTRPSSWRRNGILGQVKLMSTPGLTSTTARFSGTARGRTGAALNSPKFQMRWIDENNGDFTDRADTVALEKPEIPGSCLDILAE